MSVQGWIGIAVLLWLPATFAWAAARAGRPGGARDRRTLMTGVGGAAVGLAGGLAFVPWDIVPPALWGVGAAVSAWGLITAARAWPRLPTVVGTRPGLRLAVSGLSLALSAAAVAVLV